MIYADNAATTAMSKDVLDAMMPYLTTEYGNASSTIYDLGKRSKLAIETARSQVAAAIGAKDSEIFFTGCGTEADNWAIKGVAQAYAGKGKHLITCKVEHHGVLYCFEYLEKNGFSVTYLPVDENGLVNPADLQAAITPQTTLVSIMMANNEIGTIQPIAQLAAIAKANGVLFHTDAVQTVGHIPVQVDELGVDLLSMSAHKFHGPKGVGALYVRKGVKLGAFLHGGAQEGNRRAGTENTPGIVGMGVAIEQAVANLPQSMAHCQQLRDAMIEKVFATIKHCRLNGDATQRLPGNVNISFQYIEGEALLLLLAMAGIAASSGSACTSGSLDPSHVLLAIGLPHEIAHGSLRLSFSHHNTMDEVNAIADKLVEVVARLRAMSPLYEGVVD